jgi:hypothetical protein
VIDLGPEGGDAGGRHRRGRRAGNSSPATQGQPYGSDPGGVSARARCKAKRNCSRIRTLMRHRT